MHLETAVPSLSRRDVNPACHCRQLFLLVADAEHCGPKKRRPFLRKRCYGDEEESI
jgi:hypothetical protein